MLRSVNNSWQGESGEPMTALKDDEALVGDVLLSAKKRCNKDEGYPHSTLSMHFDYVVSQGILRMRSRLYLLCPLL